MTKISDKMREWADTCCVDYVDKADCDELRALADRVDDEMVELPRDRDGVPIHVGDTVWDVEDGMEFEVKSITMYAGGAAKVNAFREGCDAHVGPTYFTHTRPDSWERLEEDSTKGLCEYFGMGDAEDCKGCHAYGNRLSIGCNSVMACDIIRRAKALAGVDDCE